MNGSARGAPDQRFPSVLFSRRCRPQLKLRSARNLARPQERTTAAVPFSSLLSHQPKHTIALTLRQQSDSAIRFRVLCETSSEDAVNILQNEGIHIVISNLVRGDDIRGVEVLRRVGESKPHTIRLLMSHIMPPRDLFEARQKAHIFFFKNKDASPDHTDRGLKSILYLAAVHYEAVRHLVK